LKNQLVQGFRMMYHLGIKSGGNCSCLKAKPQVSEIEK